MTTTYTTKSRAGRKGGSGKETSTQPEAKAGDKSGAPEGLPRFLQKVAESSLQSPVGETGDPYEQEADAVSEQALRGGASAMPEDPSSADSGQRNEGSGSAGVPAPPGQGVPLPERVRDVVEPMLGVDLGSVQVHKDATSQQAAQDLGSRAFTHGNHIWLGPGRGRDDVGLLTHEAVHAAQQMGGGRSPAGDTAHGRESAGHPPPLQRQVETAPASVEPDTATAAEDTGIPLADREEAAAELDTAVAETADTDTAEAARAAEAASPETGAESAGEAEAAPESEEEGAEGEEAEGQEEAEEEAEGEEEGEQEEEEGEGGEGGEGEEEEAAGGVGASSDQVEGSGAGDLPTGDLALIDEELAEHQRWAGAGERVGAAGSSERAAFIAEAVGSGLLGGAGQGAAMGLGAGLVGRAATYGATRATVRWGSRIGANAARFTPVPAVGAILGGAMSVYGLANRDWSATAATIGEFGEGASTYETLANSIAAVSEIIDIVSNILNVVAGILGIISAAMWAAAVLSAGALSPLAGTLTSISLGIGIATGIMDGINAGILQPCVILFQTLHSFTSEADPREVEAQGDELSQAAAMAGGALGGWAGGKAAGAGGGRPRGSQDAPPAPDTPNPRAEGLPPAATGDGPRVTVEGTPPRTGEAGTPSAAAETRPAPGRGAAPEAPSTRPVETESPAAPSRTVEAEGAPSRTTAEAEAASSVSEAAPEVPATRPVETEATAAPTRPVEAEGAPSRTAAETEAPAAEASSTTEPVATPSSARPPRPSSEHYWVSSYTRSDGTQVRGHWRRTGRGSGGGGGGSSSGGGGKSSSSRPRTEQARARQGAEADLRESIESGIYSPQAMYTAENIPRDQLVDFVETGQLPTRAESRKGSAEFSHLYSRSEYPEWEGRSDLGVITTYRDHRLGHHGGDTRVPLHGRPRDPDWDVSMEPTIDPTTPEGEMISPEAQMRSALDPDSPVVREEGDFGETSGWQTQETPTEVREEGGFAETWGWQTQETPMEDVDAQLMRDYPELFQEGGTPGGGPESGGGAPPESPAPMTNETPAGEQAAPQSAEPVASSARQPAESSEGSAGPSPETGPEPSPPAQPAERTPEPAGPAQPGRTPGAPLSVISREARESQAESQQGPVPETGEEGQPASTEGVPQAPQEGSLPSARPSPDADPYEQQQAAHRARFTEDNQPVTGVVRANPNYPPPPGTPEELSAVEEEIASLLSMRAQAEQAESDMSAEVGTHRANQTPIQEAVDETEGGISAVQAHREAVARREQANQAQQQRRQESESLVSGYPSRATGLSSLTVALKAFQGMTHLASYLPGRAGRAMGEMNEDATGILEAFDEMDSAMEDQNEAQPARQRELEDDASRIEETDEEAVSSDTDLTAANEGALGLQETNEQRLQQCTQARDQASQQKEQLGQEIDDRESRADSLAQQLQDWAVSHQAARQEAIEATRQRAIEQGFEVVGVQEG